MAETSLYRRHRPQAFDEVVGQEHVVRTLRNAVTSDRVHHAYLFVGSRGTGKTSLAKILARSLNCATGPTATPCGECDSCRALSGGSSLDVIEMDAASNRSVDDIRELREQVGYAPAAGRWKVYILDEAHMLTREAWNAFLKTLEEPPPSTVFVLATTEPHKVMPTIVDRCQRFDFHRPSVEQIVEVLRKVAAAESISVDDGAIGAIARAATGSFRDALATLDQLVAYGGTELGGDDVLAVLGVADAELLFSAADAIASADGAAALRTIERLSGSGRDPSQFARDLIAHLRHLLVLGATGVAPDSFTPTAADAARVAAQAECLGEASLVRAIDELSAAAAAIREGDDPRTALELALLKSSRPELDPSRRALVQRLERLERVLGSAAGRPSGRSEAPAAAESSPTSPPEPNPASSSEIREQGGSGAGDGPGSDPNGGSSPASGLSALADQAASGVERVAAEAGAVIEAASARVEAATADGGAVDLERVVGLWPAVIEQVRDSGADLLSTLFEAARPTSVDAERSVVEVAFPATAAFNKRKAEAQENRERLAEALRTIIGTRLRPSFVVLEGGQEPDAADPEPEGTEEEIVERVKAAFDAEEWVGDETTVEAESERG